jgi:hypothetical protein
VPLAKKGLTTLPTRELFLRLDYNLRLRKQEALSRSRSYSRDIEAALDELQAIPRLFVNLVSAAFAHLF